MDQQALWIIAILGAGTLFGTFAKMKGGFGPVNLRVVGIVLIAVLASLLAVAKSDNLTAAMGLLGAIAGYLFGTKAKEKAPSEGFTGVSADSAQFGDNARVAGRDINETVHKIEKMLGDMQNVSNATVENLQVLSDRANTPPLVQRQTEGIRWETQDPDFLAGLQALARSRIDNWTQHWIDRCIAQPECLNAIESVIEVRSRIGWKPTEIGFDNHGDGLHINVTFEREFKFPAC